MSTEERIRELEARVAELERRLEAPSRKPIGTGGLPRPQQARSTATSLIEPLRPVIEFLSGEGALARIAITLLLGGLLFLVKYGIDQGWVNELVRVGLATLAGFILMSLGVKLSSRRILSQVLFGGGIGALYVAVFSAHVFYGLIPLTVAVILASIVSALCLAASLRYASAPLAGVALSAALATPFLLSSGQGSVAVLAGYLVLVQLTAAVVYHRARWLLTHAWTALLSVAVVFLAFQMIDDSRPFWDQAMVQLAALTCWGAFALLPLVHARPPSAELAGKALFEERRRDALILLLTAPLPLLVWVLSYGAWSLDRVPAGLLALIGAVGYTLVLVVTQERTESWAAQARYRRVSLVAGAFSLWAAAALVLTDGQGVGLLGVLAAAAMWTQRRLDWDGSRVAGGILAIIGALALFVRMTSGGEMSGPEILYDGLGVAGIAVAGWLAERSRPLLAAAWVLTLLFLEREFSAIGEGLGLGPGLATAAWVILAIGLLAMGFRTREQGYRYLGMATVGLVVGKLMLFDLSRLDPVWRILVFVGIGAALLATSYFFPEVWEREDEDAEGPDAEVPA
ncbi:MAG: DUF2339 domain-containing protein [Rhodothermales bacterium]|nr:DUF2339 domain-containing protein [Rhodothermales bacterium]